VFRRYERTGLGKGEIVVEEFEKTDGFQRGLFNLGSEFKPKDIPLMNVETPALEFYQAVRLHGPEEENS